MRAPLILAQDSFAFLSPWLFRPRAGGDQQSNEYSHPHHDLPPALAAMTEVYLDSAGGSVLK